VPTVDVWTADLDVPTEEVERVERYLDPDELARAERFRFARDRRRFVVRRGLLREHLGRVVAEAPERLVFTVGPWGKPALRDHRCRFSLSHSHERMALAISDVEVGCDIERIDEELDWGPIAAEMFEVTDLNELALLEPTEARAAFFRCWTRMEAHLKAEGHGFTQSIYPISPPRGKADLSWQVSDPDTPPGYALAVAAARHMTPCRVRTRHLQRAEAAFR
jgi:4'-phosphopantetheinyl transferase